MAHMGQTARILLAALALLGTTGCYKRVISTRGVGSQSTKVEEPYRSETKADKWMDDAFSKEPKPASKTHWVEK